MSHKIEFTIDTDIDDALFKNLSVWCKLILDCVFDENICLSVHVASKEQIKKLNAKFRNINSSTNVLSFPDEWPEELVEEMSSRFIGDLVVSSEVVELEAKQQSKLLAHHWQHMLAHGILHLAGYDHINEEDASKMEQLEVEILATMKVPNPYIEKAKNAIART